MDAGQKVEDAKMTDYTTTISNTLTALKINTKTATNAEITETIQGKRFSVYEIKLNESFVLTKAKRSNLAEQVGFAIGKPDAVRVNAVAGKEYTIGIEIPNDPTPEDNEKKIRSNTSFIVGEDIRKKSTIADITEMPHLLVGGTTGSGKSVFINAIITTILKKSSYKEVQFLMIDPKVTELTPYEGIPHLLCPVVTETHKAIASLNWAAEEMDRRYNLIKNHGRNIEEYNATSGDPMSKIIIIIDEFADLMMTANKGRNKLDADDNGLESLVARIAQKGRAAGMHLIVATQYPKADIITGVIKANLPSRVAFSMPAKVNSNVILGAAGAEALLGKGDMLFKPIGGRIERLQGLYVSDDDVEGIVSEAKTGSTQYDKGLLEALENEKKQVVETMTEEYRLTISARKEILKRYGIRLTHEQMWQLAPIGGGSPIIYDDMYLKTGFCQGTLFCRPVSQGMGDPSGGNVEGYERVKPLGA